MILGIRPTVDFAFKRIFGSPEHTAVTRHFLNAILGDQFKIEQVTIVDPNLAQQTEDDKLAILDVRARDEFGRLYNIEPRPAPRSAGRFSCGMRTGWTPSSFASCCPSRNSTRRWT